MTDGRDSWRQFKNRMKEKRTAKEERKRKWKRVAVQSRWHSNFIIIITVERLSAEMSGKLQKYSRIGAREFVAYEYDQYRKY